MKRAMDVLLASCGLLAFSPILLTVILLVWLQDFHSPFYVAKRVGRGGKPFRMVKLRSMVINAEKSGVDSTAVDDKRITWIGHVIRRWKLDELSQLLNVVGGQMSLVGPRPNVERDVALYTKEERRLLEALPGITDLASIVFSDEGEILKGSADPDLKYHQVIRPWKSRLALLSVDRRSLLMDLQIVWLTACAILSKQRALKGVERILQNLGADEMLIEACRRETTLKAYPPPGADAIVESRVTFA